MSGTNHTRCGCFCEGAACEYPIYPMMGCCSGQALHFFSGDLDTFADRVVTYGSHCGTIVKTCNHPCEHCTGDPLTGATPVFVELLLENLDLSALGQCYLHVSGQFIKFTLLRPFEQIARCIQSGALGQFVSSCKWLWQSRNQLITSAYNSAGCEGEPVSVSRDQIVYEVTRNSPTNWHVRVTAGTWVFYEADVTTAAGDCSGQYLGTPNAIETPDPLGANHVAGGGTVDLLPEFGVTPIEPSDLTLRTGCDDPACPDCCVTCAGCCYGTESVAVVHHSGLAGTFPIADACFDTIGPKYSIRAPFFDASGGFVRYRLAVQPHPLCPPGTSFFLVKNCSTGAWSYEHPHFTVAWGESDCCPEGGFGDPNGDTYTAVTLVIGLFANNCCDAGDGCETLGDQDCDTGECLDTAP